ncbi:hypothetical protein KCP73_00520 [Salmonella enterica subsp. enterica]|nr:hypothetical protein KCP73_00520 [Salmonella enterica subsp. enterica]
MAATRGHARVGVEYGFGVMLCRRCWRKSRLLYQLYRGRMMCSVGFNVVNYLATRTAQPGCEDAVLLRGLWRALAVSPVGFRMDASGKVMRWRTTQVDEYVMVGPRRFTLRDALNAGHLVRDDQAVRLNAAFGPGVYGGTEWIIPKTYNAATSYSGFK